MNAVHALAALTDEAMGLHGRDAHAAAGLLAREAPGLCDAAETGDLEALLRSVEHIGLGHLDDSDWVRQLAAPISRQLPRAPALATGLSRVEAALALAAGATPDLRVLPPAEQVRAHANAALACTRRPDFQATRRLLDLATTCAAQAEGDPQAQRAIAALAHNLAADLREGLQGPDEAAVALMLEAATRSRAAWAHAGGWLEVERADWHLALCFAAAGQGQEALHHARATLTACQAHRADDFELCFAWQAMALAALAAGEPDQARQARAEMARLATTLDDPGFAAYAAEQLALIDAQLG